MVHNEDIDELRDNVRADLIHLRDTWHRGMDLHIVRRESPVLRRLLVDNGGDIARLWKADRRHGKPMMRDVFDLDQLPTWRGLGFAVAETVTLVNGLEMDGLFLWEESVLTPEFQAELDAAAGVGKDMTLSKYLSATCLVANERGVQRDDLICYVANRRGGNHFDRRSVRGNPRRQAAHRLLDELSAGGLQIDFQDATFGQLVPMVRNLVSSPDVQTLMD